VTTRLRPAATRSQIGSAARRSNLGAIAVFDLGLTAMPPSQIARPANRRRRPTSDPGAARARTSRAESARGRIRARAPAKGCSRRPRAPPFGLPAETEGSCGRRPRRRACVLPARSGPGGRPDAAAAGARDRTRGRRGAAAGGAGRRSGVGVPPPAPDPPAGRAIGGSIQARPTTRFRPSDRRTVGPSDRYRGYLLAP
jgi:hypothetical protein